MKPTILTTLTLDRIMDGAAYDVVVAGAGGAGMAAALFSALEGQKVLLVERAPLLGGTTAWSAGTTWIPGSQHAASVGAEGDTPEKAAEFLRRTVGNHSSEAMRQAFLRNGPAAVARLEAETEVRFRARPLHPDGNVKLTMPRPGPVPQQARQQQPRRRDREGEVEGDHPRCPAAGPRCRSERPAMVAVLPGQAAGCHLHHGGVG